nr:MAG TPA: hypothetical protein [Caudoviricetes sp.]
MNQRNIFFSYSSHRGVLIKRKPSCSSRVRR